MDSRLPPAELVTPHPRKPISHLPPRWFSFVAPSVADLIFLILLIALSVGALVPKLLGDAGTGWHICAGQLMLATHKLPRTDSFSSTMSGKPWYAWEWLYDLAIAAIHHWSGLNGVVFFTALVIALTFALLFRDALRRGGGVVVTVILLVLSLGGSSIHWFARPHVLSWLLALIWFQLLDFSEQHRARRVFWLPLLMLAWVNLHGGFLLGFALLALYLLAAGIEHFRAGSKGQWLKRLGAATLLSVLASLVNPYGYKLHVHVYQYLSNRFLMNHIDEFRSPNFHGVAQQCFAALLLITILALAAARARLRLTHLLVILFAAYSGLYASRNLPSSSILLTLIVAPLLTESIAAGAQADIPLRRFFVRLRSFSERMGTIESRSRGHLWPAALVILGLAVCLNHGRLGSHQIMDAHFDAKRFPVQAVTAIEQRGIRQPIFAPDYWGGYLIYRLYPQNKVLVDDRHDLYGVDFLKDYLRATRIAPGWDKVLDAWHVNWVLAPPQSSLANLLKLSSGWKISYEDNTAILLERQ